MDYSNSDKEMHFIRSKKSNIKYKNVILSIKM